MRSRLLHYIGAVLAVLVLLGLVGGFVDQKASAKMPLVEQSSQCVETPTNSSISVPLISTVGASFTAGVGPDNPSLNWAARLAELLGWRGRTLGVPGVGYVNKGLDRLGPLSRLVSDLDLFSLQPKVVIVQAGHNDWRVPAPVERARVEQLVRQIQQEDPGARLVFLTGFDTLRSHTVNAKVSYTNTAIVEAIRSVDPEAIVIDPFNWKFARSSDGLHPTAAGDLEIARRVASVLEADHVIRGPLHSYSGQVSCKLLGRPHAVEEHRDAEGSHSFHDPEWGSSSADKPSTSDHVTTRALS